MVPKTWPWYATSPSIWSAKSLTSDRSSAAESAPPGTRNTCWKSSARCGRNLVNLDSLPWPQHWRAPEGGSGDVVVPHPVVAPKAATPGSLTRPAAANRGKLAPRVRVPDTDRLSPCARPDDGRRQQLPGLL